MGRGLVREVPHRYGRAGCRARRKCVKEKSERGEGRKEGSKGGRKNKRRRIMRIIKT